LPPAQAEPHASLHPASWTTKAQDPMVHQCQTRAQGQPGAEAEAYEDALHPVSPSRGATPSNTSN
jgi:hypothetical protein